MNQKNKIKEVLSPNYSGHLLEAGLDEAGRGCLAGPVMAGAVILPPDYTHPLLKDSKQLNKKQREILRDEICKEAIAWAVGEVSHVEIDQVNILNASIQAMHQAIEQLSVKPEYLIVDGTQFKPYHPIPHTCIIKGDCKYYSIAAASVLAKTFRDDTMATLALDFPGYGWEQNAGYPTVKHREAIYKFGTSPYHRLSFRLLPESTHLFPG